MDRKKELQELNVRLAKIKKVCDDCQEERSACQNCQIGMIGGALLVRREVLRMEIENDR